MKKKIGHAHLNAWGTEILFFLSFLKEKSSMTSKCHFLFL